jgi:hypothetical protein
MTLQNQYVLGKETPKVFIVFTGPSGEEIRLGPFTGSIFRECYASDDAWTGEPWSPLTTLTHIELRPGTTDTQPHIVPDEWDRLKSQLPADVEEMQHELLMYRALFARHGMQGRSRNGMYIGREFLDDLIEQERQEPSVHIHHMDEYTVHIERTHMEDLDEETEGVR